MVASARLALLCSKAVSAVRDCIGVDFPREEVCEG
jgi:hypothetical protein